MQKVNASDTMRAVQGVHDRFFGILRTTLFIKPDVIHFDWIESFYYRRWKWLTMLHIPVFFMQVLFAKYVAGIKLVFTLHNLFPHDTKDKQLHKWVHTLFIRYVDSVRVFYHASVPKVITLFKLSPAKVEIAEHPHYIDAYPNVVSRTEARRKLNLPEDKKVLLFFGTVRAYKGIDQLLHVFKHQNASGAILLLAGKIHDVAYAQALCRNDLPNIKIHAGFIDVDEVQYYFNACDAVVLPFNEVESSGTVILAMSFGKPVITSSQFSVAEILAGQKALLYTNDFHAVLQNALCMTNAQLQEFGLMNLAFLKQNQTAGLQAIFHKLKFAK